MGAVARTRPNAIVVADLPWLSYHVSREETVHNAASLIRAGAGAVKLEGGGKRIDAVRAILDAEIPVMGHIGLTPQSVHAMGGYKVQGKTQAAIEDLIRDAIALDRAGAFSIVLEGIPREVAAMITKEVSAVTIGIGAGPDCDGQILVMEDMLGLSPNVPKFVKKFGAIGAAIDRAIASYADEVRARTFPAPEHTYALKSPEIEASVSPVRATKKPKTPST